LGYIYSVVERAIFLRRLQMATSKDEEMPDPAAAALLPQSPLLITESAEDFDRLRNEVNREIKPRGIVLRMYAEDYVQLSWEIARLRRCKAGIINLALRGALQEILWQLSDLGSEIHNDTNELSYYYFSDQDAKKRVLEFLKEFQLDESAIEAEAIKTLAEDLERFEKLLASLEGRRNKVLRCIADYRGDFARRLHDTTDRIIDGEVVALEYNAREKSSAA
jgi:hypothetical protein